MEPEKTELYYIQNIGCHDMTCGLAAISEEQLLWLKDIIQNLNLNSDCSCMPTIEIYRITKDLIRRATEMDAHFNILHTSFGDYVLCKPIDQLEGVEKIC